jgi:hypothetical protein
MPIPPALRPCLAWKVNEAGPERWKHCGGCVLVVRARHYRWPRGRLSTADRAVGSRSNGLAEGIRSAGQARQAAGG